MNIATQPLQEKVCGFLAFPGVEELDLAGPWELVGLWQKYAQGPRALLIGEESREIRCAKGMIIRPDCSFADVGELSFLIVPGGEGTRTEINNRAVLDFISQTHPHLEAILSVCTGALLLGAAGILRGRVVTTHRAWQETLRASQKVEVVDRRWVRSGNVWSSAGISAGMDLMLAFIADQSGINAAEEVALRAEYFSPLWRDAESGSTS